MDAGGYISEEEEPIVEEYQAMDSVSCISNDVRIKCGGAADWDDDGTASSKSEYSEFEDDDEEDDEIRRFLEETPEFRASVQYQVRIVALMPGFQAAGREVALFSDFYCKRFGSELLEKTGFTSAEKLCRSMPHVIKTEALDDLGEVVLVDSAKNNRVVAGINSGLRRIVYDILKMHPKGLSASELEDKCSKAIGKPLADVLVELAYDTPNIQCMVRDMADIASFKQVCGGMRIFMSMVAEDPATSDGILVSFLHAAAATAAAAATPSERGFKSGDLLLLSPDDGEIWQLRMRLISLLSQYSDGIEVKNVVNVYRELYSRPLNPLVLGFTSIENLLSSFQDIVLLDDSSFSRRAFLLPSKVNYRIVSTLKSGLRSTVFSVFLGSYPNGLRPVDFMNKLEESFAGRVEKVLESHGYGNRNGDSLIELVENLPVKICVMLHDMQDFVRFGCLDDGSLLLKLRDTEFPLLDFPEDYDFLPDLDTPTNITPTHLPPKVTTPLSNGLSASTAAAVAAAAAAAAIDEEIVEHRLRMIMAEQQMSGRVGVEEFMRLYEQRTGEVITVDDINYFMYRTPGILKLCEGSSLQLIRSPKNLRIISVTKAGLRQVLYWALVKNKNGVWDDLLEGWFTDFTGHSLSQLLIQFHGYPCFTARPLYPVSVFLEDMSDVCRIQQQDDFVRKIYVCVEGSVDPVVEDANLLGLSCSEIEFDIFRLMKKFGGNDGDEFSEISVDHLRLGHDDDDDDDDDDVDDGDDDGDGDDVNWRISSSEVEYDPPKAYATCVICH